MTSVRTCKRITIKGTVQGVGFRPFVYRMALECDIRGYVRNNGQGVEILGVGNADHLIRFETSLKRNAPPLALIRSYESKTVQIPDVYPNFQIETTGQNTVTDAEAARDTAVCPDCLAEMRDPKNRRYRHAFINCTNCGPRYTLIRELPYDRPATTMAAFAMCPECRREYENPVDRRFHAQPVCCPNCGPKLRLHNANGIAIELSDPIWDSIKTLGEGQIVAVKGIGGFHLVCRADSSAAVNELRKRKLREEKPFAAMVANIETAHQLAYLTEDELRLLEDPARPIVLAPKRKNGILAPEVAPGVSSYGLFLPYAPIHFLLFDGAPYSALVMTSANRTDEPILHKDGATLDALHGIADLFLLHDREILLRNDDSIARVVDGAPVLLRRARGFVPEPLPAGTDMRGIVATGGILKSTIAVGRGEQCYVSQYLGNLGTIEVLENHEAVLRHLLSLLQVKPELYACDLHPASLSRKIAEESGLPVEYVQHHHAHAAACLAENGVDKPALAIVYDGTGYGSDKTIWGGEFLVVDGADFQRVAHWKPVSMPGGDAAALHPGRMAFAFLYSSLGNKAAEQCSWLDNFEKEAVMSLLTGSCPVTSSMGRLFDAVSAMLGLCTKRSFEGQPAMLLEGAADPEETRSYSCPTQEQEGRLLLDGPSLVVQALENFRMGVSPARIAAQFQNSVVRASVDAASRLLHQFGLDSICLSGGCFQNAFLLSQIRRRLVKQGANVYSHRLISPNDEGISYGQAVIAAKRRNRESVVKGREKTRSVPCP